MDKTCFCGISEHCRYQIETDMEQHDKVIFEDGYNKAIDDLVAKLHKRAYVQDHFASEKQYVVALKTIDKIAEELKKGK